MRGVLSSFALLSTATDSPVKTLSSDTQTLTSAPMLTHQGKTGLVNVGNTCYLNSVLQALFASDEFRADLLRTDFSRLQSGAYPSRLRLVCTRGGLCCPLFFHARDSLFFPVSLVLSVSLSLSFTLTPLCLSVFVSVIAFSSLLSALSPSSCPALPLHIPGVSLIGVGKPTFFLW